MNTRPMNSFDRDALELAYRFAEIRSGDPRTKNAAVIFDKETFAIGTNRLPCGVFAETARLTQDEKLKWLVHAEADAIAQAARMGLSTENLVMYSPWACCNDCAKLIIQAGIKELVVHASMMDRTPEFWKPSILIGYRMLSEAGVTYTVVTGNINKGVTNLFRGETWYP